MNQAELLGNLGSDPEVRYTQGGVAVCNFRMATNEKYKDRNDKLQERTEWHRIVVWGKAAENCGQYLSKGAQVLVKGAIRTRKWTDSKGEDRFTTEIHAGNGGVTFLNTRRGAQKTDGQTGANDESYVDELDKIDDNRLGAAHDEGVPF